MAPAAIRYKNPGAMWPGTVATKWGSREWTYLNDGTGQGGGGKGNKIAIFPTFIQGAAAQFDLWRTSAKYRGKRLDQAIKTWSGGNHWEDYVAWMIKKIPGISGATILDDSFFASARGVEFMRWQSYHEAGQHMPMTDAEWIEAQRRVFAGVPIPDDDAGDEILPLVRIGDQGAAVSEMQKLLGCEVTGRYRQRSETEYALRLFQIRNSLDPDGICGPRTWDKLKPREA